MRLRRAGTLLAFGVALVLPPPGTESRDRSFCSDWLRLTTAEKHDVVLAAERLEASDTAAATCRAGLRGTVRHRLDVECRNWSRLMDFEVRALVDSVLATCRPPER